MFRCLGFLLNAGPEGTLINPFTYQFDLFRLEWIAAHRHPRFPALAAQSTYQQTSFAITGNYRRPGDAALQRQIAIIEAQLAVRFLRPVTLIACRLENRLDVASKINRLIGSHTIEPGDKHGDQ